MKTKTVYLVICGAGPAMRASEFIDAAHAEGWDCHVITTPMGARFIDRAALESASGHSVIGEHREPGAPRRDRPEADAVVIAPATANTVCKLATGITDTYALDVVSECIGLGVPVVVVPFANTALTGRVPYRGAVEALAAEGVAVIDPGAHLPHQGAGHLDSYPWKQAMERAAALATE